jgi:FAD-dependent fumarate reductase
LAVFLVLNDVAVAKFAEAIQFYSFKKLTFKYPNWKEFCTNHSIPLDNVQTTLQQYEEARAKGKDEFGKTVFESCPILIDEPVTVMIVTPAVHYTMGGLKIDKQTRVVRNDNSPIPGLFAAGEGSSFCFCLFFWISYLCIVTGGLHGENRLGGNSLLECVVFGRIAGREAAK